jgi:polyisoprenoid-binding protein YceI
VLISCIRNEWRQAMTELATTPKLDEVVGTWEIDPAHSSVEFSARHMMISTVRGRFDEFAGTVTIADPVEDSSAEVVIRTLSVSSHDDKRDEHLRSGDFLDAERYPEMTFRSTAVRPTSDTTATLVGDLTVRDVTRPVELDVAFVDWMPKDLFDKTRIAFRATTSIKRKDFDLTWNMGIETGGVLVGDRVDIALEVTATKAS